MTSNIAQKIGRVASKSPRRIGFILGGLAGIFALTFVGRQGSVSWSSGPMLSECDGRIRSVVMQYTSGSEFVATTYRQFLTALPVDVQVYLACPGQSDLDELKTALGPVANRLAPIFTHHPMTTWSRDRWVELTSAPGSNSTTLAISASENGDGIWPQRAGDHKIAADIALALGKPYRVFQTGLEFDGGDLLADSMCVFVSPGLIRRNPRPDKDPGEWLANDISDLFHRMPILLPDAPDHHVGMYMMAAGDNRVVVGDPSLARKILEPIDLPGGADFSNQTQIRFDSVATTAKQAGYSVTRIPCVPAGDGKTYLTYLNGIIDQRDGCRIIYLPQFRGQNALNSAAGKVWGNLGFQVIPIDVTDVFRNFGTLHCLVNVLSKSAE